MTVYIKQGPPLDQIKAVWPTLKDVMPRCATCKWWIVQPDEPNWGICAATYQDSDIRDATQVGTDEEADFFYTREDFGCVGWEGRGA